MSGDSKSSRTDPVAGRDRHRDAPTRNSTSGGTGGGGAQDSNSETLLSRLGDQERARKEDEIRDSRKRSLSDREKEGDQTQSDVKRVKIQRDRFNNGAKAARMGLPVNDRTKKD